MISFSKKTKKTIRYPNYSSSNFSKNNYIYPFDYNNQLENSYFFKNENGYVKGD